MGDVKQLLVLVDGSGSKPNDVPSGAGDGSPVLVIKRNLNR